MDRAGRRGEPVGCRRPGTGVARVQRRHGQGPCRGRSPSRAALVSDVLQALASLVMVSSRQVPAQPAWLPAWPVGIPAPADAARAGRADLAGRGDLAGEERAGAFAVAHGGDFPHHAALSPVFQCLCAGIRFRPGGPASARVAELPRADLGHRHREHRGAPGMVRLLADPRHASSKRS